MNNPVIVPHRTLEQNRSFYYKAFESVISLYQEMKATYGIAGALDYSNAQASSPGAAYSIGRCLFTPVDFIADVQIVARKALTPDELRWFNSVFVDHLSQDEPKARFSDRVKLQLGFHFQRAGLYPVSSYTKPVKVR